MQSSNCPIGDKFETRDEANEGKILYNFSPGPCILPRAVLEVARDNVIDYNGTGQSVMELSHRGPQFHQMSDAGKNEIRKLLNVPETHTVMLNQGGATAQYTGILKNLIGLKPDKKAMYFTTGLWSEQCIKEARRHLPPKKIIEVTNTKASGYTQMTDTKTWKIDKKASFMHICTNETVHGFEITEDFPWEMFPEDLVIVADMSSHIGTFDVNWKRFDVVYGGLQKNLGPAGGNFVIVRKDLLHKTEKDCPMIVDWTLHETSPQNYFNTPPVWTIYVTSLFASYMNQQGGVSHYNRLSDVKSRMIYDCIDKSNGFYTNKHDKKHRSRVNIVFKLQDESLLNQFIQEATSVKCVNIKGHPSIGGLRVSLYNAMPLNGVVVFCRFMDEFKNANLIKLNSIQDENNCGADA